MALYDATNDTDHHKLISKGTEWLAKNEDLILSLREEDGNEQADGSAEEKSEWGDVKAIHEKILGIFAGLAARAGQEASYMILELQELIGAPVGTRHHLDDMVSSALLEVYEDWERGRVYSLGFRGRRCIVEKGLSPRDS